MKDSAYKPEGQRVETVRVLLADTSRWACSARLAIELSKASINVSAVCPTPGHPLLKTRVVQKIFPYSGLRPLVSLVTAIEVTTPQVIIPCDDRAVQHLHELYVRARSLGTAGREIAALIERSLGRPESYPIVSSRYDLLKIAREEGLRVANTNPLRDVDDLKLWNQGQPLPWVLKADGTWGGKGVKIVHTQEQAKRAFLAMREINGTARVIKRLIVNRDNFVLRPWWNCSRPTVIVQSYIRGRPANCAVMCRDGKVLGGFGVEVLSAEGLTGPASVVRVVDNPEMMICAKRIARRLRLSGFFGLDFVIEEVSGATYLIEMNPRSTPLCHLQLGKGRDMIEALRSQLLGQPLRETHPVTQNCMIAYFPAAWHNKSEFLQSSFHDVPIEEPALVQELLKPWPNRSLIYRMYNQLWARLSQASPEATAQ